MSDKLNFQGPAIDGISTIRVFNGVEVCVTANSKESLEKAIQDSVPQEQIKETFTIPKESIVIQAIQPDENVTRH